MEDKTGAMTRVAVESSSGMVKRGAASNGQKKHSIGRQKIPIKRIQREDARQVCFSKRRAGLFKKAHELSVLCGAHLAVLVFSPAKKAYSFGHPSVNHVIDRYLASQSSQPTRDLHVPTHHHDIPPSHDVISQLNREMGDVNAQLIASRKRKEMLESALKSKKTIWNADVADLGLADLHKVKEGLERLWSELEANKDRLMLEAGMMSSGYEYGFNNYGYGMVDQKVNPMMLSAAPVNMAMPDVPVFPSMPDQYPDLGLFFSSDMVSNVRYQ